MMSRNVARPAWMGCLSVLLLAGCASPNAPSGIRFDAGPLATLDDLPDGGRRLRALGPLLEHVDDATHPFHAVRPFYSRSLDPVADRSVQDVVWPWGTIYRRGAETGWRFFPAYGHDFDRHDSLSRYRWSVFPLLFGGRSAAGEGYFAVFPMGGVVCEFLGRDRIEFYLFPLYVRTAINDLTTHSILWPVGSRTSGPGVHRFRIFPLYGYAHREDRWTKRFVAWPFWTSVRYHHKDLPDAGGFMLFPVYGRADVGNRQARLFLPPFFKYERAPGHWAMHAPWPFVRLSRGDIDRSYFWPVWGKRVIGARESGFYAWPMGSWERIERVDHTVSIRRVAPFWYAETHRSPGGDAQPRERHLKVWPFFGYRREADVSRFRAPELWPLRDLSGIERNWAPLWSWVRHIRHGDARETDVLWGLYRHRRETNAVWTSVYPLFNAGRDDDADARNWSLLGGMLGYQRAGGDKQVRILYVFNLRMP